MQDEIISGVHYLSMGSIDPRRYPRARRREEAVGREEAVECTLTV